MPCVSADLVLVDLAPILAEPELETALVAAESLGILKRRRLAELVTGSGGRPGIPKLASLLALEPAIARSELELIVLPICRAAGVDRPSSTTDLGRLPAEAADRRLRLARPRLVLEADSQRFHGDWGRRSRS